MQQLGILAKYWAPGEVKTRLAVRLGDAAAARLHFSFLSALVDRFGDVADRRILAFWPPDRAADFAQLAGRRWQCQPQSAGDLGARIQGYFDNAFAAGAEQVVLVGSDSPTLPRHYVELALTVLQDQPVVLGPTPDGGYYLVGARDRAPPIFDAISWSSSAVWGQTLDRLSSAGCRHYELPAWYDVDTAEDLLRLRRELSGLADQGGQFSELHRQVEEIVQWSTC